MFFTHTCLPLYRPYTMSAGLRIVLPPTRSVGILGGNLSWESAEVTKLRRCITRAIADQARTIRIPVHMIEWINKLIRTSRALVQELGREPTSEEIAKRMDIPVS